MTASLPSHSRNLWADSPAAGHAFADPLPDAAERFDAIVVGAGVTGLSTALAMTELGLRPLVLERRSVGAGTSGRSTAKVSVLQGDRTHRIERRHGERTAQVHVRANLDGLDQVRRWCQRLGVPVQTRDSWSYATDEDGAARLRAEVEASQRAGLAASAEEPTELPFSTTAAVRLPDQCQLEPLGYLRALAGGVRGAGGHVVEGAAVTAVSDPGTDGLSRVRLEGGEQLAAPWVVLATLLPFPLRTLLFATSRPVRSYLLAAPIDDDVVAPESMYLSVSQPTRSLRVATTSEGRHLLVGGNSHVTGRSHPTSAKVRDLADWAASQLGVRSFTHRWSAQDYTPADLLPHVGSVPGTSERLLVASGYSKWGFTAGTAAGLAMAATMAGQPRPWAEAWSPRVVGGASAVSEITKANLGVAASMLTGWLSMSRQVEVPAADGEASRGRAGVRPVAASRSDGDVRRPSAVCPHLGGVVAWNDAEESWDCPLHGSRFSADGAVLCGPAVRGLGELRR